MASWMTASDVAARYSLGGCDPCGCTLPAPPSRPAAGSTTDITDESKGRSRGSAPVAGSDHPRPEPSSGDLEAMAGPPDSARQAYGDHRFR
jgi:hypothetical protein